MKKIIIIYMLLAILFNSIYVCFASEKNFENIKYEKTCEGYLKHKGNLKIAKYAFYEKDGKKFPAYCINPEYSGVSEKMPEYSVNINEKINNEKIWKAIINGYPYKTLDELKVSNKEEAYTATQFAIYTVLHNRNVEDYESVGTEAGNRVLKAYKQIMKGVDETTESMKIDLNMISEKEKWEVDEMEYEYLSKVFVLQSNFKNGKYSITLNGENIDKIKITNENGTEQTNFKVNEKFKILAPIDELVENLKFEIEINGDVNSKPILFGKTLISETQNYALTGNSLEEFNYKYEDEISKNLTKIKIQKEEKISKKRIEGVKFNLLNSNKDSVLENLITDENGEIIVENIIPGTYFLQEIYAPEQYQIIEDPIEININLNETIEITIENELKEIPKEEVDDKEFIKETIIKETETIIEKVIIEPQKTLPITGY